MRIPITTTSLSIMTFLLFNLHAVHANDKLHPLFSAYPATEQAYLPFDSELSQMAGIVAETDKQWFKETQSFAGKYVLGSISGGTGLGRYYFLINSQHTDAEHGFLGGLLGNEFYRHSRLIIINGENLPLNSEQRDTLPSGMQPRCLVLNQNETFEQIEC